MEHALQLQRALLPRHHSDSRPPRCCCHHCAVITVLALARCACCRVRIGTAVLKSAASAAASSAAAAGAGAGAAATPAASPGSAASPPPQQQQPQQQQELVVVIKEYEKSLVERRVTRSGQPVHEDAKSELRLHASLCREPSSPHIVRLYDLRADATHYFAILEFCSRGEFFAFVSHPNFTREHARHFFRQLIVGVDFMHRRGVAHRDLSLENILLDEQHVLKVGAHILTRVQAHSQ